LCRRPEKIITSLGAQISRLVLMKITIAMMTTTAAAIRYPM
jgi:hypothetical protein